MSTIDSNNIGVCKVCGAVVWWDRIKDHADWHWKWEGDSEGSDVPKDRR